MAGSTNIRRRKKNRKRVRAIKTLALFVLVAAIILCAGLYLYSRNRAEVFITVNQADMLKGEEFPEFSMGIEVSGNREAYIDEYQSYTVDEFVKLLEKQEIGKLVSDADTSKEGEYSIKLELEETVSKLLANHENPKVKITVEEGTLWVKHPIGNWEGNKFQRYDGTYLESSFVESEGGTYYIGEDGEKVTGWQTINNVKHYFKKDGVMVTSAWKKIGDDVYYLSEHGHVAIGWQEIDGNTYYFDMEGKRCTGTHYLGIAMCTFDEKGVLISKEATNIDPEKPMIALTFDDGPGNRTGELLEALEKYDAHATFFVLGQRIDNYPKEIKKMYEIGCEVANHSYSHENLSLVSKKVMEKELKKTNNKVKKLIGQKPALMRPPYGAISDTMRENSGMPMILWNVDTLDWKTRDAEKTVEHVMEHVKDGDIILMHDIHSETVDAVIEMLPKLQEEGYQLVTVSELAAAKEINLEFGKAYRMFD